MIIKIDQKILEKIIQYLVSRPYQEVFGLIQELSMAINESLKDNKKP